jgi:hypothetical protein
MVRDLALEVNAQLTILGDSAAVPQPVSISSFGDHSLSIDGAPPMVLGAPVKILQADCLLLGLVMESRTNGSATIKIIHVLNNLSELTRLAGQFACRLPSKTEPEPTLS